MGQRHYQSVNKMPAGKLIEQLTLVSSTRQLEASDQIGINWISDFLTSYPLKRRRICVVSPPNMMPDQIKPHMIAAKQYISYYPMGSLFISAAVRLFNPTWEVVVVDLNFEAIRRANKGQPHGMLDLLELIPDDCDVYGLSWMFAAVEQQGLSVLERLRGFQRPVIAGGVQSTNDYQQLLDSGLVDLVFRRESEVQLNRLLELWEWVDDSSVADPAERFIQTHGTFVNLACKTGGEIHCFGEVYEKPPALDIRKEYDKLDITAYQHYASPTIWCRTAGKGRPWATMINNRGCRAECTFCAVSNFMGRGTRGRNVADVVDEILHLYHEKGVRHIEWMDDDLLADQQHTLQLLNTIAALNLDLTWSSSAYVLAVDINQEMAQAMVESGCVMTGFGVETGDPVRLKSLRKPASHKRIRQAVEIFHRHHHQVVLSCSFILGFPDETYGEMFSTFDFARELKLDWSVHAVLQPLRGTSIYNDLQMVDDSRTLESFGETTSKAFTIGRDLVSKGFTFDDYFKEIIDFRTIDRSLVPDRKEVELFQVFFNVFVNLVGNVNLTPEGVR